MKYKSHLAGMLLLVLGGGALIVTCHPPGPSPTTGSLTITIGSNIALNIAPNPVDLQVSNYHVRGDGPGGVHFDEDWGTATSASVDRLIVGSWTITVTATNSSTTTIGTGSWSGNVAAGVDTEVQVSVIPGTGSGTLSLTVTWAGTVLNPQVTGTLTPLFAGGSTIFLLPSSFSVSGNRASLTNAVPKGNYALNVTLADGSNVVGGGGDNVWIVASLNSSGTVAVPVNTRGASITITGPTFPDSLNVSIAQQPSRTPVGSPVALSASVSNYAGSLSYLWYVNGVSQASSTASFTFSAGYEGYYRIDAIAYSSDGSRAGSATTNVEAVQSTKIHATDFSSDPQWVTSAPSRYYWNSGQQVYQLHTVNQGTDYAVKYVDFNMAGKSFELEWDFEMVSVDYACGIWFGLWDTSLDTDSATRSHVGVVFSKEDRGFQVLMQGANGAGFSDWSASRQYSLNTWYHIAMNYDATTGKLIVQATDRAIGTILRTLSATVSGNFASDMDKVGSSNVRDVNTDRYQAPGAQATGYVDNVKLSVF